MAIATTDILIKASVATGPGNANAQANVNNSLGGFISTTQIVDATLGNLFSDVTGDQNAAGQVDYRCIFAHNSHATLTLLAPVVWIAAEVAGGANTAIAIDNVAATAIGSTTAQATTIASSTTAPTAVGAFSAPTTKAAGLALGDLGPGQCRAIWIRRTATNSAPLNNDGTTVRVEGDTTA